MFTLCTEMSFLPWRTVPLPQSHVLPLPECSCLSWMAPAVTSTVLGGDAGLRKCLLNVATLVTLWVHSQRSSCISMFSGFPCLYFLPCNETKQTVGPRNDIWNYLLHLLFLQMHQLNLLQKTVTTSHVWLFNLKVNKMQNSVSQLCQLHFTQQRQVDSGDCIGQHRCRTSSS